MNYFAFNNIRLKQEVCYVWTVKISLEDFSLVNHQQFAKLSSRQTFLLYGTTNPPVNESHLSISKISECIDLTHTLDTLSTTHLKSNCKIMPNDHQLGIVCGEQLTNLSINSALKMLKKQFSRLNGLNSTLLQYKDSPLGFIHLTVWRSFTVSSLIGLLPQL